LSGGENVPFDLSAFHCGIKTGNGQLRVTVTIEGPSSSSEEIGLETGNL
jgi:hypothetical protein